MLWGMHRRVAPFFLLSGLAAGCSTTDSMPPGGTSTYVPTPLAPLETVVLTDERSLTPRAMPLGLPDPRSPADPVLRDDMLAEGYGEVVEAPGRISQQGLRVFE